MTKHVILPEHHDRSSLIRPARAHNPVLRIDIVRHGDRTKKVIADDGASIEIQSGYLLSDFGKAMNGRQASAIRQRHLDLPPFDTVEIWGSSVGPHVPYPGLEHIVVGRSGYTAQQYADIVAPNMAHRAVMRATDLFNYNFPAAPPAYKHTDLYDAAFIKELKVYLHEVGIRFRGDDNLLFQPSIGAGETIILDKQGDYFILNENSAIASVRDQISRNAGKRLQDLPQCERALEEQFVIDKLINYAADKAQQVAARGLIMSAATSAGRSFAREYAGGLAYALMHYVERITNDPYQRMLAIFGIHGPLLESLLLFTLRKDRRGREIDGLSSLDEIAGAQHVSESFSLSLGSYDSHPTFALTANDASKMGVKDLPLDMAAIQRLADELKNGDSRTNLRHSSWEAGMQYGALGTSLLR